MGDPWEAGAVARCPACNKEVVVSPQAGETVGMCVCRGGSGVWEKGVHRDWGLWLGNRVWNWGHGKFYGDSRPL